MSVQISSNPYPLNGPRYPAPNTGIFPVSASPHNVATICGFQYSFPSSKNAGLLSIVSACCGQFGRRRINVITAIVHDNSYVNKSITEFGIIFKPQSTQRMTEKISVYSVVLFVVLFANISEYRFRSMSDSSAGMNPVIYYIRDELLLR